MFLSASAPVAAQSPALERVEEFTRLGRAEEARTALLEWWEGARDDASRRDLQRGLWLRGRLTVDPVQAELDFQRLVVLYPSGPFTPEAIFRLAQSAHAQGDVDGAERHVAMLARDYPNSRSRSDAEAWLRAAGPAPPAPDAPRVQPRVAEADTTLRPARDAAPATVDPPAAAAGAEPDPAFNWFVQFGAFSEEPRALALHAEALAAGLDARVVRVEGSGFLHVRIGRFDNRIDANTQLEEVAEHGFAAAIVRDDRAEEVVRR